MATLGRQIRAALRTYSETDDIFRRAEEDEARRQARQREQERFDIEKRRNEREEAQVARDEALRQEFETLESGFRSRTGDFSAFGGEQPAAQPAPAQAPAAPAAPQPPAAPARAALGGNPQAAAPAAEPAPAPAPTQADDLKQFLSGDPAKLYGKNAAAAEQAYYQRLGSLMRRNYVSKGDYARAAMVDAELEKLQEARYEPARRAAAAAAISGAPPESLQPLLDRVYGTINDGREVKIIGMKVDPSTGLPTYSMEFAGKDGKAVPRTMSGTQIYGMLREADALNVVKFNVERAEKQQEIGLARQRVGIAAQQARDAAETNRSTRAANEEIRKRQQEMREDESAAKLFGSAFGVKEIEIKPKDEIEAMLPAQRQAYEQQRSEQQRRRELASYAQNIYSLNERAVPAATIAQAIPALQRRITEGRGADGVDEKTGLPFVNINGKKILLPKD
jgi:hypothetical protein